MANTNKPTKRKLGRNLVVGDVLETWGSSHARTITHFEPHPGLFAYGAFHSARVACSGEWGMTVFDDDYMEVW